MKPITLVEVEKILKDRTHISIVSCTRGVKVATWTTTEMAVVKSMLINAGIIYEDQEQHNVILCVGNKEA